MKNKMHVAIIMDGNGRWAQLRGLPRTAGHAAGAKAVKRVVEAAAKLPIDTLTLYAFSCDNWARPAAEVRGLFALLKRYLRSEASRCVDNGVCVRFIGRRDRLTDDLRKLIDHIEQLTSGGQSLLLRIAVDYSSRDQILRASASAGHEYLSVESFGQLMSECDVDLLIRTGGERRLSDFLLWECAYAELEFVSTWWPDFDEHALRDALAEFSRRQRRFGAIPSEPPTALIGES